MFPRLMYAGRTSSEKAAMIAYQGSPTVMITTRQTSVSELNESNSLPTAK